MYFLLKNTYQTIKTELLIATFLTKNIYLSQSVTASIKDFSRLISRFTLLEEEGKEILN